MNRAAFCRYWFDWTGSPDSLSTISWLRQESQWQSLQSQFRAECMGNYLCLDIPLKVHEEDTGVFFLNEKGVFGMHLIVHTARLSHEKEALG